MYIARNRDIGTIYESEVFKNVYKASIRDAKEAFFMGHADVMLVEFSKCDEVVIIEDQDRPNFTFSYYINEEHIAYLAINAHGMTIDTKYQTIDINKEGK